MLDRQEAHFPFVIDRHETNELDRTSVFMEKGEKILAGGLVEDLPPVLRPVLAFLLIEEQLERRGLSRSRPTGQPQLRESIRVMCWKRLASSKRLRSQPVRVEPSAERKVLLLMIAMEHLPVRSRRRQGRRRP